MPQLTAEFCRTQLDACLEFWLSHGLDSTHGGLFTHLDQHGTVFDPDKSIWAQARWAWMLSRMDDQFPADARRGEAARSAWSFLQAHGTAPDGSMYFSVTADGRPLRKRRYVFSECFAAMAAAQMGHVDEAHRLIEGVWSVFNGQTPTESKTDNQTRPMISLGLPMILLNVLQVARETVGMDDVDARIDACINAVRPLVHDGEQAVLEVAAPDGSVLDHAQGRQLNPGHAIEAASFVLAEAMHRQDETLQDLGLRMLGWSFDRGWDAADGGLKSFVDLRQGPCVEYWHELKFWWPQFEALVCLLRAHACTGNAHWLQQAQQVHDWIQSYLKDPDGPEYFGYLRRDGTPSSTHKGDLWKGAFHIPRALLDASTLLA